MRGFLKRQPELSVRFASNIKRSRACTTPEIIHKYLENLNINLKNVPPTNIRIFDESNLTDDPGSKKVVCKRSAKYVQNVINTSKMLMSVLFCGNATCDFLPVYVDYRTEHFWNT